MAVVLGLALLGAGYESVMEDADGRAYPPPGQLVDVGGHRLHLHCAGTGGPTVVIEAGLGDWSASWSSWVQPEVARTTRVCTYDRAGMGFSEAGPRPRTAARFAEELHTLLLRAGVPGPYVLVGHSAGGLTVRVFAHDYAADVAGVVLIESMHPEQARPSAPAAATPPPAGSPSWGDRVLTLPARLGVLRLLSGPLDLAGGMSPEVAGAYAALSVTPRFVQTMIDEGRGLPDGLAQAGAVASVGAVPVIVLSRGRELDPTWQRLQDDLVHLSTDGRHLTAGASGHNVQLDQPEAAIEAIVQLVERIRRPPVP